MKQQRSYEQEICLYLIPTPIGNLQDITLRAIDVLKNVDLLLCEDTRVTEQLLKTLNIKKKLISCHNYNEDKIKSKVVDYLQNNKKVGLVTDRGTPIISDPGYKIVKEVIRAGFAVVALPGPTALIPALISSGIEPSPFLFYGFLNSKKGKREQELENLKQETATLIFYESCHRIKESLVSIYNVLGDRKISIHREISKIHEEIYRGYTKDIISQEIDVRGEFVIVVEGNKHQKYYSDISVLEHVKIYLDENMSEQEAIKKVAKDRGVAKTIIYKEYHTRKKVK